MKRQSGRAVNAAMAAASRSVGPEAGRRAAGVERAAVGGAREQVAADDDRARALPLLEGEGHVGRQGQGRRGRLGGPSRRSPTTVTSWPGDPSGTDTGRAAASGRADVLLAGVGHGVPIVPRPRRRRACRGPRAAGPGRRPVGRSGSGTGRRPGTSACERAAGGRAPQLALAGRAGGHGPGGGLRHRRGAVRRRRPPALHRAGAAGLDRPSSRPAATTRSSRRSPA